VICAAEEREILDTQELLELKGLALDGVETRIKDATAKIEQMGKMQEELDLARKVTFFLLLLPALTSCRCGTLNGRWRGLGGRGLLGLRQTFLTSFFLSFFFVLCLFFLQLYFNSLYVNIKLGQLIQRTPPTPLPDLNAAEVFEKCLDSNVPMSEWPSYVSDHFLAPKEQSQSQ